MPEDPTPSEVPSTAAEDSFAEHLTSDFVKAAEKQVDILIKAATRVPKLQIRILTVVCAALLVISGVLGYVVNQAYDTAQQLRHDAVANCQSGDTFRANQIAVWEKLFHLAPPPKDAKSQHLLHEFLGFVESVNASKNCSQAYSVTAIDNDNS